MLGFESVFRYTAGKVDWFAGGLPRAGELARERRAGDVARRDVPSCRPDERRGDVGSRTQTSGWTMCVVVDDERVVLGLLEAEALAGDPATPVDQVMRSAPATLRPHLRLEEVAQHLAKHKTHHVLITTPEGRLIGVVERSDLEPGKGSETIPR